MLSRQRRSQSSTAAYPIPKESPHTGALVTILTVLASAFMLMSPQAAAANTSTPATRGATTGNAVVAGRMTSFHVGHTAIHTRQAAVRVSGWIAGATRNAAAVQMSLDGHRLSPARVRYTDMSDTAGRVRWFVQVRTSPGTHTICARTVQHQLAATDRLGCHRVHVAKTANQRIVAYAAHHLGQRYVEGAEGPTRFDCSGLVQYTYRKAGIHTPRTADQQYHAAHRLSASRALPGDLVFYHDSSGYVYHVAIYTGHDNTIVAANTRQGVIREHIWDPHATFGSFTHRR